MVLAGTRAMFLSEHVLAILLTMLLFAALLAVGFGLYGATPLTRRIRQVRDGTARLAGGDLATKLPVDGRDEISGLAEDFNRMARALKEAAAREREMEQARRDLIAAVSHDLRTPLSAVRALIEAVVDGVATDEETADRYLRSAQSEIMHLSRLVDDLFELAQIDAGVLQLHLERASLHDLVSDALSSFQPQAEQQGVRLVGEVSGDVDPVLINPPKLQRVLYNLISNALRHMPADGTILFAPNRAGKWCRSRSPTRVRASPPKICRTSSSVRIRERSRGRERAPEMAPAPGWDWPLRAVWSKPTAAPSAPKAAPTAAPASASRCSGPEGSGSTPPSHGVQRSGAGRNTR
jgi:signal transduction histidine kinase